MLLILLLNYLLFFKRTHFVHCFEYLFFPLQVIFFQIETINAYSLVVIICFGVQLIAIIIIIIWYNSNFNSELENEETEESKVTAFFEINEITKSIRIVRILKIVMTKGLSIYFEYNRNFSITYECFFLLAYLFLFSSKFTYQNVFHENILLIFIITNAICVVEKIINVSKFNIFNLFNIHVSEIFSIVLFCLPSSILSPILLEKYKYYAFNCSNFDNINTLGVLSVLKSVSSDINEKNSIANYWSFSQRNELLNAFFNSHLCNVDNNEIAFSQLINENCEEVKEFYLYEYCVHYLLRKKKYEYALIIYYKYNQINKCHSNNIIYKKIISFLRKKILLKKNEEIDCEEKTENFLEFTTIIETILIQTEEICYEEIIFLEYLEEHKNECYKSLLEKILKRKKKKDEIIQLFVKCALNDVSKESHVFKLLYLLFFGDYCNCSEKTLKLDPIYIELKTDLTVREQENEFSLIFSKIKKPTNIVVITDLGEIIKTNESFRSHFKEEKSINSYIPTVTQTKNHNKLMKAAYLNEKKLLPHEELECWLLVEKIIKKSIVTCLENCTIKNHIYYRYDVGLHYVCEIIINEREYITLAPEELTYLQKMNGECVKKTNVSIFQLSEQMKVANLKAENESIIFSSSCFSSETKESSIDENNKIQVVEKLLKTENLSKVSKKYFYDVIFTLLIGLGFIMVCVFLEQKVENFNNFIKDEKQIVEGEQQNFKKYELLKIAHIFERLNIINISECYKQNFSTIEFSIKNIFNEFLLNDINKFVSLLTKDSGEFLPPINKLTFESSFIKYPSQNVSLFKEITFLKSQILSIIHYKPEKKEIQSELEEELEESFSNYNDHTSSFVLRQIKTSINEFKEKMDTWNKILYYFVFGFFLFSIFIFIFNGYKDRFPIIKLLHSVNSLPKCYFKIRKQELKLALKKIEKCMKSRINLENYDNEEYKNDEIKDESFYENFVNETNDEETLHLNKKFEHNEESEFITSFYDEDSYKSIFFFQSSSRQSRKILKFELNKILLKIFTCAIFIIGVVLIFQSQMTKINEIMIKDKGFETLIALENLQLDILAYTFMQYNDSKIFFAEIFVNHILSNFPFKEYENDLIAAFGKAGEELLNANPCSFSQNITLCEEFQNSVLKSGIRVIVPMVFNHLKTKEIKNRFENICAKTTLLFYIYSPLIEKITYEITFKFFDIVFQVTVILFIVILLIMLLIFKWQYYEEEKNVYQEILSLDKVEKLFKYELISPCLYDIYYN